MHRPNSVSLLTVASVAFALAAPSVALARYDYAPPPVAVRAHAPSPAAQPAQNAAPVAAPTPAARADAQLAADLAFMREEEKLAHDVYTALAKKWDARIFTNIAAGEQRHTDTMAALLDHYDVADPADGRGAGEYENDELQALYKELVTKGSASLAAAREVGKTIEKTDIADLDERIARTSEANVLAAYKTLRTASEGHLRAFSNEGTGSGQGKGNGSGGGGGKGRH